MRILSFKLFEEVQMETEALISRGKISIYEINSYDSLVSLFDENPNLYNICKWSIAPRKSGFIDSEKYFNLYYKEYPNFFIIIDNNINEIIGLSIKSENNFIGHWSDDRKVESNIILDYLSTLNIKIKDLIS
jgi:hypothetical protein